MQKRESFFASKISLLLNYVQLSVKEYNENVTDVLFDKGMTDTKTIEKTTVSRPLAKF